MNLWNQASKSFFNPVDISSLVMLRISYAVIMLWEVERHFNKDWINDHWIKPLFHFGYQGFEWVKPWPGDGMIIHFYVLAFLSLLVLIGFFYRIAIVLLFFAFTYVFLLEKAYYLNHFYLVSLISFLLIFLPANKKFSADALLRKKSDEETIPAWAIRILQFQIGLVYIYGALAKINYDWLVLAQPMQSWLGEKTDFPLIGQFFDEPGVAYLMSWSGVLIDLFAPLLLFVRKTRPFMYAVILAFHYMNDRLFHIGIFPWFMILFSTVFFPPDWPKRFIGVMKQGKIKVFLIIAGAVVFSIIQLYFHRSFEMIPLIVGATGGAILIWTFIEACGESAVHEREPTPAFPYKPLIVYFLVAWMLVQMTIPLRHYFIRGDASWTGEGHWFAWRMMLRQNLGRIKFFAYDPETQSSFELNQSLSSKQYDQMSATPHMIIQYAKHLKEDLKNRDIERVGMRKEHIDRYEIRAEAFANLNCRIYMRLIDANVDLSKQTYSDFRHNSWILTQEEDLASFMPEDHCGIMLEE